MEREVPHRTVCSSATHLFFISVLHLGIQEVQRHGFRKIHELRTRQLI